MKYFIDTEFIEGFNKPMFGKNRHFIDLISIGIYCEDGREYYAVSNEFNPNDADEWVKENVLKKIELDFYRQESTYAKTYYPDSLVLKNFMKWKGKSNKSIANDIYVFCLEGEKTQPMGIGNPYQPVSEFYGYYADYDWVLLCSLFGRMIDLPKGFPMYCIDLKQMMQERGLTKEWKQQNCPDPEGEHNALVDAKWNYQLYSKIISEQNPATQQSMLNDLDAGKQI
jgi:hypothetical protein